VREEALAYTFKRKIVIVFPFELGVWFGFRAGKKGDLPFYMVDPGLRF
jgi:hypothetical protein